MVYASSGDDVQAGLARCGRFVHVGAARRPLAVCRAQRGAVGQRLRPRSRARGMRARQCWRGRSYSARNSSLAASRRSRCSAVSWLPARLMKKTSIDIAERKGVVFRRSLRSAERWSESAISCGSCNRNTPGSRSRALLWRVTSCDQRSPPLEASLRLEGFTSNPARGCGHHVARISAGV